MPMTSHTCDSRLIVAPDGDGSVIVDAVALMTSPHQVRYWMLDHDGDGVWHHWQSGQSGPLVECLGAITAVYAESSGR